MSNYEGAIDDFTKAIELNPTNADIYMDRGRAKRAIGDLKGCADDFEEAVKLDR
jgi:Flp pilus assembly protein TadD